MSVAGFSARWNHQRENEDVKGDGVDRPWLNWSDQIPVSGKPGVPLSNSQCSQKMSLNVLVYGCCDLTSNHWRVEKVKNTRGSATLFIYYGIFFKQLSSHCRCLILCAPLWSKLLARQTSDSLKSVSHSCNAWSSVKNRLFHFLFSSTG